MILLREPIRFSAATVLSGLLAAFVGIFYVLQWVGNGGGFQQDGDWTPLFFLVIAVLCLASALGIALGQRWGLLLFLVPCVILLLRSAFILLTPRGVMDTFGVLEFISWLGTVGTLTLACCLIALVIWFRRKWLTVLGLPIAALLIVPSYCLFLFALTAPGAIPLLPPSGLIVSDSFESDPHGWLRLTGYVDNKSFVDGVLHWNLNADQLRPYFLTMYPTMTAVSNFDAKVEMRSEASGADCAFGLGLRYDSSQARSEIFAITNNGKWIFETYNWSHPRAEQVQVRQEGTFAVMPAGQMNQLEVHARGTEMTFQVNGETVSHISNVPTNYGAVSFVSIPFRKDVYCPVEVDNLEVRAS